MTLGPSFAFILNRGLGRLAEQLVSYADERNLWMVGGQTKNSPGTLALHLVGNLEHFIGNVLGGTGYERDRDAEFGERDVPREELLKRIDACRQTMSDTLGALSDEQILAPYPAESPMGLGDESAHTFLLHLTGHLSWHLGQIDYHRRIVGGG